MSRRREAFLAASALCVAASGLLTALQASADDLPGQGFLGYTLTAQAAGVQVVEDEPAATTHPEAEAEVPQSQVSMVSGPLGYALSSVAWPGALAANAGALLVLAGAPVPPDQARMLNDPVRAETRTGGPASVTNDSVPGASMHAAVGAARVAAQAVVDGGDAGRSVGFGTTTTSSSTVLGAATATTTADSSAKDVSLAAGAVTVGSLVSHATASTDGRQATGSGTTTVTGLRVAGVPVTVDEHGVSVAGTGSPVDQSAVDSAVATLGMTIALSRPASVRQGGAISYDAGSLVVSWHPPGTSNTLTVVLGGARVTAAANPADATTTSGPVATSAGGTVTAPATGGTTAPLVGRGPGGSSLSLPGPGTAAPTALAPAAPRPVALAPLLDGETAPASAVALCAVAALLLLGGLLRLPRAVLVPAPTTVCPDRSAS